MKKALITSAGLAIGLLAASATMADQSYSLTIKNSDFRSAKTVEALYTRIQREARKSCPSYFVERNLREISNCRADIEADLVSKIDHPLLNAYVKGEDAFRMALNEHQPAPRS